MFSCWYTRLTLARWMESTASLPAAAVNHLRACPECRARFHQHSSLAAELRREANALPIPDAPPFLSGRILATLDAPDESLAPASSQLLRFVPAGLVALVALIAFSIGFHLQVKQEDELANAPVWSLPLEIPPERLAAFKSALHDPLQNEMDLVVDDAKRAAHVVAQNFLPDQFVVAAFPARP